MCGGVEVGRQAFLISELDRKHANKLNREYFTRIIYL